MSSYCPNCGYKQICPCKSCSQIRKTKKEDIKIKPWIDIKETEYDILLGVIQCSNCGFQETSDWWENLSVHTWMYFHRKELRGRGDVDDL